MRNEFIKAAQAVVPDPYILVNLVSLRVKQLRQGSRPLIESLESLSLADVALREIGESKISYELAEGETNRTPLSEEAQSSGRYALKSDERSATLFAT